MKIGVLLSRVPYPLEKGDKLRAYYQLKELSKNHEIFLCAISTEKVDQESLDKLSPLCKELKIIRLNKLSILLNLVHGLFFSNLPLQVAYFFKKSAKKEVQRFFRDSGVEHLFCQLIRVSEYVKDMEEMPKTLDYMDALSRGMERRLSKSSFYLQPFIKIETLRLKSYEHFVFSSFQNKTIISEQDRELVVHADNREIEVIRNGVDMDYFHPQVEEKKYDILFTGNMSYAPNVEGACYLVEEILPLLSEKTKGLRIAIVGAKPSLRIQALKADNVTVTGWVDDIRTYYNASKIFVAPMLIGTGLQNKLLEAMAMKMPCITTPLANNALKAENKKSILIAENKEEFSEYILNLLKNKEKAIELAEEGHKFVAKNYNWKVCTKKLEDILLRKQNE